MTVVAPSWAWLVPVWVTALVCVTVLVRKWIEKLPGPGERFLKVCEDLVRGLEDGSILLTHAPLPDRETVGGAMTSTGKTVKLRISFAGIERNALRGIRELEALAREHADWDEDDNGSYAARSCISAYRDTILALCKGIVDIEAVKDFWLHGEDVTAIPFRNDVLRFSEEEEASAPGSAAYTADTASPPFPASPPISGSDAAPG